MHEIPFLLYFKIYFWLGLVAVVIYAIELSGTKQYPYQESRHRWHDMLRLISNAASAAILYQLCWGQW